MNCRRFQNQLHEYVEDSLSARNRAACASHLSHCDGCRQAVLREQNFARFFSGELRRNTESLSVNPQLRNRIVSEFVALKAKTTVPFLNRFKWPLAVSGAVALIVAALVAGRVAGWHSHRTHVAHFNNQTTITVQLSYQVPRHEFLRKGNLIIDTFLAEKVIVDGTFVEPAQNKSKTPL